LDYIGDVAQLTLPELQSQFGFAGKRLWQLSRGIDDEPLYPRPRVESLIAAMTFEAPVAGIEVLVAASRQLLGQLQQSLHSRAVREFTLQADLESGRGWQHRQVFREAISEYQRLVFLLKSVLQNSPPPTAVRSLTLCLTGLAGETGKQMSLGERGRLQRQLQECVRQLKARYGYSPIYRCMDVESWSVIPEERQILVESDG
jgi:DNA polymerase-4/protein ImuB